MMIMVMLQLMNKKKNVCEETNVRIFDDSKNKLYEINVLGTDSKEIIEHMIKLI